MEIKSKITTSFTAPRRGTGGLFELVLLAVVAVLLFFFLINPKRAQYSQAKKNLSDLQDTQKALKADEAKLDGLVKSMKSNPKALEDLDEAIPLNGRVTKLRLIMEYITKSSGMSVGDITVNPPVGDQIIAGDKTKLANPYGVARKVRKYECSLSVTGTTEQFQSLLEKLENSGRILDITSLDVSSSKDGALQFRMNLQAYAYE